MINYVEVFDSFKAVQKDAKAFTVTVLTKDGKEIASSAFPCQGDNGTALSVIADAFEHAVANRTFFSLWCRGNKTVVAIAVDQIVSVSVHFV